ncbi:MAG: hypothetical protein QOF14_1863 [Hyphomicrobiales bacterium]|jgi:hypothetical protein|nr:hypothetical protein [Hyphomicrobiales bacterium]
MKHSNDHHSGHFGGIEQAFKGLVAAQVSLGKELFKIAADAAGGAVSGFGIKPSHAPSCCHIPEPCWMPLQHGPIHCLLEAGSHGTLDLDITNEDFQAHSYAIQATGADAGLVKINPPVLTLGPKLRGTVQATFALPNPATKKHYEAVIWVIGCRSHYIRWRVDVADKCCDARCCHELSIQDQPDYVMHWYDHFYCARPCMGGLVRPDGK